MQDILDNELNLKILKEICSGNFVEVNYSHLSKRLRRHRNTITKRVKELFKHKTINKPVYPFFGQFREHPIMIFVQADIPPNKQFEKWIENDNHIFAAYNLKRGEYNTLLILFHRTVQRYYNWRQNLISEGKIPPRAERYPSAATFFSSQMMVKYAPSASIQLLKQVIEKRGKLVLDNFSVDKLSFKIMEMLANGEAIRTNETQLAYHLGVNRKTVKARIKKLKEEKMILDPACRFPNFFCPPNSVLAVSLIEIKKNENEIIKHLRRDPHISFGFQICTGKYNYLLFEVFEKIADHIKWEHDLNKKFSDSFGANDSMYLTPNMTAKIEQQKVSLAVINKKLELLKKPTKKEKWNPFIKAAR